MVPSRQPSTTSVGVPPTPTTCDDSAICVPGQTRPPRGPTVPTSAAGEPTVIRLAAKCASHSDVACAMLVPEATQIGVERNPVSVHHSGKAAAVLQGSTRLGSLTGSGGTGTVRSIRAVYCVSAVKGQLTCVGCVGCGGVQPHRSINANKMIKRRITILPFSINQVARTCHRMRPGLNPTSRFLEGRRALKARNNEPRTRNHFAPLTPVGVLLMSPLAAAAQNPANLTLVEQRRFSCVERVRCD